MIKKILNHQFLRFLLTGGLNTAFGYMAFSVFTYLTGNPSISVILANIVGVLFNFKTYGSFVFKSKDNSKIYRFCGAYLFITTVQILSLKGLANFGITNPYLAGAILTLPMAALSFIHIRKFVFHEIFSKSQSLNNRSQDFKTEFWPDFDIFPTKGCKKVSGKK